MYVTLTNSSSTLVVTVSGIHSRDTGIYCNFRQDGSAPVDELECLDSWGLEEREGSSLLLDNDHVKNMVNALIGLGWKLKVC